MLQFFKTLNISYRLLYANIYCLSSKHRHIIIFLIRDSVNLVLRTLYRSNIFHSTKIVSKKINVYPLPNYKFMISEKMVSDTSIGAWANEEWWPKFLNWNICSVTFLIFDLKKIDEISPFYTYFSPKIIIDCINFVKMRRE